MRGLGFAAESSDDCADPLGVSFEGALRITEVSTGSTANLLGVDTFVREPSSGLDRLDFVVSTGVGTNRRLGASDAISANSCG